MNLGSLRTKVTIQKLTDRGPGKPPAYVDDRQAWAAIAPIKLSSRVDNDQLKEIGQYKITLWNSGEIDTTYRIKTDAYYYGISDIEGDDPFSYELTLTCNRIKNED